MPPPAPPPLPAVVFVAPRGTGGGPNQSLLALLGALDGVYRVVVAPSGFPIGAERVDESITLAPGPIPDRKQRARGALRLVRWAWPRRGQLTAFHANGVSGLNLAGPAAFLTRRPVVVWAHASKRSEVSLRLGRAWARRLPDIRWAAVSDSARRLLVDAGLAAGSDVTIIPNPIDATKLTAAVRHDDITVAYLGGPAAFKGLHVVAATMHLLADSGIRWFAVVGAATADNPVIAQMRALPDRTVELSGWVGDVRRVYAGADVVFCPSFRESFGRIAAEAMGNGIPVVASDIPAFRQLLGDGEAGLLFPPGDASAAAAAIALLARNETLRRKMGDEGRRRAEQFDPAVIAGTFRRLYGLADHR